jgi:hypothetical protein
VQGAQQLGVQLMMMMMMMMKKRSWPNTAHWELTPRSFRLISQRAFLKTAAEQLGIERKDLRSTIDRDMEFHELKNLDKFLVDSLQRHIDDLEQQRETAANLIREIWRRGNERSDCVFRTVRIDGLTATSLKALTGHPLEALYREVFAEVLAEERAEKEIIA